MNFPQVTDEQAFWAAHVISEAIKRGIKEIEVSQKAEDDWVAHHISVAVLRDSFYRECTPGYYTVTRLLRVLRCLLTLALFPA